MSPSVPLKPVSEGAEQLLASFGGKTSDLYRALANHDEVLRAWIEMAWGIRTGAKTPRALREVMILRCAQVQEAGYQWNDHYAMATAAGVSTDQIDSLSTWRDSELFDDRTRSALSLTEEMMTGSVTDETLASLADEFDADERVELIVTAGFYCMVPRVLDALRLKPGDHA